MARQRAVRLSILALIVIGLAILALWRVGMPVKESTPVGTSGSTEHRATAPLTAVAELLANNAVGREASLDSVEIREMKSPRMFWAGRVDEERVFVVLAPNVKRDPGVALKSGSRATLIGVVRAAPPADQAVQDWHIDSATATSVADRGTYLDCTEIRPGSD
jgi:hypothetical protein